MSVEEQSDSRPEPPGMVLVLDDDDLMREAMRRILEARGHTVATAETAADAIEFCEASNAAGVDGWISLVIADVGAAGAEFGTRVASARPGLSRRVRQWDQPPGGRKPRSHRRGRHVRREAVQRRRTSTRRSARRSIGRRREVNRWLRAAPLNR